jgi:hypothetical protein
MLESPFHRYNLFRNPFGELSREERAELAVVDIARWQPHFQDDQSVLQFLGHCGHGKTTHLLAIRRVLPNAEYIYLPEDRPLPTISNRRPVIIDEAQRLSFWELRRVLKAGGPLIVGTHDDLSKAIRRAGLNVTTFNVAADSSSEQLQEILNRRIEASRLGNGTVPRISSENAVRLRNAFGSDVRAIEQFLYEQFQQHARELRHWPPADSH